jgi:hypothetical protein
MDEHAELVDDRPGIRDLGAVELDDVDPVSSDPRCKGPSARSAAQPSTHQGQRLVAQPYEQLTSMEPTEYRGAIRLSSLERDWELGALSRYEAASIT